jgi:hypothetical protein
VRYVIRLVACRLGLGLGAGLRGMALCVRELHLVWRGDELTQVRSANRGILPNLTVATLPLLPLGIKVIFFWKQKQSSVSKIDSADTYIHRLSSTQR